MNKEQILSIIRFALTTIGVILVTNGNTDEITYAQISGALMALVSGIWSIFDKTDAQMTKKLETFANKSK